MRLIRLLAALAALALILGTAGQAKANLIVNGGFETGDFTGWTTSGNNFPYLNVDGSGAHSGNFGVDAGPIGSLGFVTQTVATSAGQSYTLSFWEQSDGATTNEFVAQWNGNTLMDVVDDPSHGFQQFTFTVTGTGSDTVNFGFRDDPGFLQFDDVSLDPSGPLSTPEPASLTLIGLGAVSLMGYGWRRKTAKV